MSTYLVPPRWAGAAHLSGRHDLRPALDALGVEGFLTAPLGRLAELGLPIAARRLLAEAQAITSPDPWTHLGAPDYPAALLALPRPPPVLFWRGDRALLETGGLAVVGARACTPYGRRIARRLGRAIAVGGGIVISGSARGIDAAAHAAACGRTVAVLGAGLEAPSAARARGRREQVLADGGLLISEFLPRDPPTTWTFPLRNRLIAALSRAVVVVEAAERSGALITARIAAELGREVMAVPGPIDAPASAGALALIAQGAICLTAIEEALTHLPGASVSTRLLDALAQPGTGTEIARRAGLALPETLRALVALELTGALRRLPDQRYVLAR